MLRACRCEEFAGWRCYLVRLAARAARFTSTQAAAAWGSCFIAVDFANWFRTCLAFRCSLWQKFGQQERLPGLCGSCDSLPFGQGVGLLAKPRPSGYQVFEPVWVADRANS